MCFKQLKVIYLVLQTIFLQTIFIACNQSIKPPQGDKENAGLFLPDGFEALVVVDSIGRARHLAVSETGDIYVKLRVPDKEGRGLVALRDTNEDGKADIVEYFGGYPVTGNYGTAMRIYSAYLYFSTVGEVYRYKMDPNFFFSQEGQGWKDWKTAFVSLQDNGNIDFFRVDASGRRF